MKTLNATTKACTATRPQGSSKTTVSALAKFGLREGDRSMYRKWTDADYAGLKVGIRLGNGSMYFTRVKSWDSARLGVVKKYRSMPKRRKLQYAERAECGMKNGHYMVNPVWASVRFTLDGPASTNRLALSKDVQMLRKMVEAHPLAEREAISTNSGIEHYYGMAGATSPGETLLAQHHPKRGGGGIAWHAAPGHESAPEGIMAHAGARHAGVRPEGHGAGYGIVHHSTGLPGAHHHHWHAEAHGHGISEVFFRMYLRIPGLDPYAVCVHSHHAEEHDHDDGEGHHGHGFRLHVSDFHGHGWHGHHDGHHGHGTHGEHLPHAAWHSQHIHHGRHHGGHHGTGHGHHGGRGAHHHGHGTHHDGHHGHHEHNNHSGHRGSHAGNSHHEDGHSEVFFRVFLRIPGCDPYAVHISNHKAAAIRLACHAEGGSGTRHPEPGGRVHGYDPGFVASSTRRKIIYPKITQGAAGIST